MAWKKIHGQTAAFTVVAHIAYDILSHASCPNCSAQVYIYFCPSCKVFVKPNRGQAAA